MDSVGLIDVRGGNVDIVRMPPGEFPPIPLEDGLICSAILDETLGPNMVGGSLNKENGSLKISLTWKSIGSSGLVKGRLKFGGRRSFTTSTLTKPVS